LKKIPVIILNWNGFDDTVECVESLLRQSFQEFTIYLIDNNSDNEEFEKLNQKYALDPRIVLKKNEINLGFTLAHNQVFEELINRDFEFIALLNNDAVADDHWLENMYLSANESNADITASLMLNYFDHSLVDSAGLFLLSSGEILPFGHGLRQEKLSLKTEKIVAACGGACLYRTQLLREIGIFDTYFSTGYEDAEFGLRATIAGKKVTVASNALVYHKISRSVSKVYNQQKARKIQEDINYTYLKTMPLLFLIINSLINLIRWFFIILLHILTLRFKYVGTQCQAMTTTLTQWNDIVRQRKKIAQLRKISSWQVLERQTFVLSLDIKRFSNYILKNRPNQFEKYSTSEV